MKKKENELFSEIKRLLWEYWDPIGVNDGENEWDDEYDSYVPHTFRLANEGNDWVRIKSSLDQCVSQSMGMTVNHELNERTAKKIVEVRDRILG